MIRILTGDCRDVLKSLPDQSVHCIVTSPPYFGLRDYGTATWLGGDPDCTHVVGEIRKGIGMAKLGERYSGGGHKASEPKMLTAKVSCPHCGAARTDSQIGLEPTSAEYVLELVAVFREIWRVLRDDGVCWLNLGDSYAGSRCGPQGGNGEMADRSIAGQRERRAADGKHTARRGAKPKELMGMPWRVAFALSDDGWYLRSNVIWSKPNPMPESCTDRPTTAHEHVFLLAKSGDSLFWTHRDGAGARKRPEPDYRWTNRETGAELATAPDGWPEIGKKVWRRVNLWTAHDYFYDAEAIKEPGTVPAGTKGAKGSAERFAMEGVNSRPPEYKVYDGTRNARSVWTIATSPFSEAHFATFPPKLAETCIAAGTSEHGACQKCGAPWVRTTKRSNMPRDMSRPQAARAVALYETSGLTPDHLIAIRACGITDAGKALQTQSGVGKNNEEMQRLASEAKAVLGGYHREFLLTSQVTVGWQPTCACAPAEPVPCLVLDPFGGAGTVGMVADRMQRDSVLIELKAEYVEIMRKRIEGDASLLSNVQVA